MTDRGKKIVFALVFAIISIALGIGLYIFFFRPLTSPPVSEPTPPAPGGTLPTARPGERPSSTTSTQNGALPAPSSPVFLPPSASTEASRTLLLRDGVTQALVASPTGSDGRFYNPEDGRFYTIRADGSIVALSERQFFNVQSVDWGKKKNEAILEFPDGSNVFYDFENKSQATLPKHWQDFDFSPDDRQVVAKSVGLDPSNRFLMVSQTNGNEAKAIETLGANADRTIVSASPNNQIIAFALTGNPQPEGAQEILLIGQNHENFKSLIVPGRGFLPNWSPTGGQLLYSVYHERNDLKPSLWVSGGVGDTIGENRRGLNLNTWADKCVWKDEQTILCGVPQSLDIGAGLSRDKANAVPDDVYQVDLKTGVSVKINRTDQIYPIRQPILNADKTKLLFTDAVTGRLYSYELP